MKKVEKFIVINSTNQVFSGFERGKFKWSDDWDSARELPKNKTKYLTRLKGTELLKL